MRLLFCNITWMREYKGKNRVDGAKNDPPFGGGAWVGEHGTAQECCNFLSTESRLVYGHVETISGDQDTQIRIENLGASKDSDYIDDVDVIWIATSPEKGGRRVVGWYKNARVYRYRQKHKNKPTEQHTKDSVGSYRITANKENAHLVEENERDSSDFQLGSGKGWPGEKAIFYPNNHIDQNKELNNFIKKLYMNKINKSLTKKNTMFDFNKILDLQPQAILTGPPGTGKTFNAEQLAISQATGEIFTEDPKAKFEALRNQGQIEIVQFHPSYNYEDFVRGIQVSTDTAGNIAYTTQNRILADMARKAQSNKDNNYVLIIDEINRANLASVLGELIYALEYRNEPVRTPYASDGDHTINIPENLYIIGTMNTADRSVGHIDYAVRRRFVFIPCLPEKSVLESYYTNTHNHLKTTALNLFDSVAALFGETETNTQDSQGYLAPDFFKDDVQVGHTYFMAKSCEELAMKFAYQVYPLLREYYKDGILVSGNDGKIDVKIDLEQSGDQSLRVDAPEESQRIFEMIVSQCKE